MPLTQRKHIVIVGAGLAGTLLAKGLADLGYRVSVFERRSDPRAKGYVGGRSINLALSVRGIEGLKRVGLADRVMHHAIAMPGRMVHPVSSPLAFQAYSKNPDEAINSISRGGLNLALIEEAAKSPSISFHFDQRCTDVDLDRPAAIFEDVHTRAVSSIAGDLIIGADGAFSPVRGKLQVQDRFQYSQSYLGHGYKELHIPPTKTGDFAMQANALHIWPRGGAMMIALPNTDRSFTCTLFWPFEGEHGFASLRKPEDVDRFFRPHYPDAVPLMPTLTEDYLRNPTGSLVTVRCWPWRHEGKVLILGDAAHAIVPFFGQGMNCAFEDCVVLLDLLEANRSDLDAVLGEFQARRKPNADAIADMALENFVEMRDKVGSPAFLHRKKLEHLVHELFPKTLIPKYNLVSFSSVAYTEAKKAGERLDAVLDDLERVLPLGTGDLASRKDEVKVRVEMFLRSHAKDDREVNLRVAGQSKAEETLLDLSPTISPRLGVWPGDTPPSREVLCDITQGSNVTLSTLRATVHRGTHADGPNHYGNPARSIEQMPLHHYIGPCQVIDAPVARGTRVRREDLRDEPRQLRVLIRTGTFPNPEQWNNDFAALSAELVSFLHERGVITIGIDTPSVDLIDSKDLPAHKAFLRHGIAILEGLKLDGVAPADYELIAPPLKLEGFDASPIRAVLRPLS